MLRTPFSNLPPELLHQIVLAIDLPNDLLSFALTCRLFSQVVIPDFLKYCKTRCYFIGDDTWTTFSERPILCEYVKFLKIPFQWSSSSLLAQADYPTLRAALHKMKNLISFRGYIQAPPSTLVRMTSEALVSSGCVLKQLELNIHWHGFDDNAEEYNYSIFSVSS